MNCEVVTNRLITFLDGRLAAGERAEIEAHLATCAECRRRADEQRDVAAVLNAVPPAVVSPSFGARLSAALDEQSGWYGIADWRWLSARVVPVATGLLVAAAIVVGRTPASTATATTAVSLTQVVESWASGGERMPAAAVLWKDDVSQESAVLTVLAASPDSTITGQSDER